MRFHDQLIDCLIQYHSVSIHACSRLLCHQLLCHMLCDQHQLILYLLCPGDGCGRFSGAGKACAASVLVGRGRQHRNKAMC